MSYHRFAVFFTIALGNGTHFHLSPLAGNFLHNAIVVVAIFVSKARHITVNVEVAVLVLVTNKVKSWLDYQVTFYTHCIGVILFLDKWSNKMAGPQRSNKAVSTVGLP